MLRSRLLGASVLERPDRLFCSLLDENIAGMMSGSAGYQIERSLRFNPADSAYLSKTFAGASTSDKIRHFSAWWKITGLTAASTMSTLRDTDAGSSGDRIGIGNAFAGGDTIQLRVSCANDSGVLWTSQVARDPTGWMHVYVQIDTTQATANNRIRIWINGKEVTSFASRTNPALDATINFGSTTRTHYIGRSTAAVYSDMLLSEYIEVDGGGTSVSDFGETDAQTGVWVPKKYTGAGNLGVNSTDRCTSGTALSSSDDGTYVAANAFADDGATSYWRSNDSGGAVSGTSYIGYNFGSAKTIRRIAVRQGVSGLGWTNNGSATSVKVQYSDNGSSWSDAATASLNADTSTTSQIIDVPASGSHQYWRLLLNSAIGTGRWQMSEMEMMEFASTNSYGSSGFWLKFADNSNTTAATLGKDSSGNGHNWTPNNFSVAAGAGNDSLTDTPTNYGTAAGGGELRGNYATWNTAVGPITSYTKGTHSNGALVHSGTSNNYSVATQWIRGKRYFEYTIDTYSGGFDAHVGLKRANTYTTMDGSDSRSLYLFDGRKYNGSLAAYGSAIAAGTTVACAVDVDAGKVWWGTVSGGTITWIASGDPAAGTNAAFTDVTGDWLPSTWNGSGTFACTVNFGQRAFAASSVPSGFKAVCTQALDEPSAALKNPRKGFKSSLYTGNGSTQSITGLLFGPDLLWIKDRSVGASHLVADAQRGATIQLITNNTDAEQTAASMISAFTNDGFSVGNNSAGNGATNTNTNSYVAWCWDESSTYGFDIVLYTGNGTARNIAHSLGATPHLKIVKDRSTAATGWHTYHRSLPSASTSAYLLLSGTAAEATVANLWNNGDSSAEFGVGTYNGVNENTKSHVAYLWTSISGFSFFGSYTGNSNTDGPVVTMGFRPAWSIHKRTDSTGSWLMFDSARSSYNPMTVWLQTESANSEGSTTHIIDYLAQGEKIRGSGADLNSGTHIFAAFADDNGRCSRAA